MDKVPEDVVISLQHIIVTPPTPPPGEHMRVEPPTAELLRLVSHRQLYVSLYAPVESGSSYPEN